MTDRHRAAVVGGVLLGVGLGGFVDGIVLHQILQWHHMLTDHGRHSAFPAVDVASLEDNTLWDGLFHVLAWILVAGGTTLLWFSPPPRAWRWSAFTGLLITGWGLFNTVEGVVDHYLLGIHHVRDDVSDPFWWDLGFLALGVAQVVSGVALYRWRRTPKGQTPTV